MIGVATTTVSVLRGTTVSDDGDLLDNGTPSASGIPAAFREVGTDNQTEASNTPGTVRQYMVRVPSGTDVLAGDRLLDERTQLVYRVDFIKLEPYLAANMDKVISASKTD